MDNIRGQIKDEIRRVTLPNNGYCEITDNSDGSQTFKTVEKCITCKGTKKCKICFGAGGVFTNMWYPCTSCKGTTVCNFCNGTGYTKTYAIIKNGVAVGHNSAGVVATGSSLHNITNSNEVQKNSNRDIKTRKTEQKSCSFCQGTGKNPHCDYGPQYTSDPSSKTYWYCPVCKKNDTFHTHGECISCGGKGIQ